MRDWGKQKQESGQRSRKDSSSSRNPSNLLRRHISVWGGGDLGGADHKWSFQGPQPTPAPFTAAAWLMASSLACQQAPVSACPLKKILPMALLRSVLLPALHKNSVGSPSTNRTPSAQATWETMDLEQYFWNISTHLYAAWIPFFCPHITSSSHFLPNPQRHILNLCVLQIHFTVSLKLKNPEFYKPLF